MMKVQENILFKDFDTTVFKKSIKNIYFNETKYNLSASWLLKKIKNPFSQEVEVVGTSKTNFWSFNS